MVTLHFLLIRLTVGIKVWQISNERVQSPIGWMALANDRIVQTAISVIKFKGCEFNSHHERVSYVLLISYHIISSPIWYINKHLCIKCFLETANCISLYFVILKFYKYLLSPNYAQHHLITWTYCH